MQHSFTRPLSNTMFVCVGGVPAPRSCSQNPQRRRVGSRFRAADTHGTVGRAQAPNSRRSSKTSKNDRIPRSHEGAQERTQFRATSRQQRARYCGRCMTQGFPNVRSTQLGIQNKSNLQRMWRTRPQRDCGENIAIAGATKPPRTTAGASREH